MATQRKYGVPASVTIAQAIDESGWGQSILATNDHNLFGIKGTGPAGSDVQPTQEVINGQLVNLAASFQIYQSIAQSIDAHGRLLARSDYYAGAMAQSRDPNAFAAALTGVYATDPAYGAKLIQLMKHYDLYRFDRAASHGEAPGTGSGPPATHHTSTHGAPGPPGRHKASRPSASPGALSPAPARSGPAPAVPRPRSHTEPTSAWTGRQSSPGAAGPDGEADPGAAGADRESGPG